MSLVDSHCHLDDSQFDSDRDAACATRRAFCARSAESRRLVLGTHFAPPTAGRITAHENAWRFSV